MEVLQRFVAAFSVALVAAMADLVAVGEVIAAEEKQQQLIRLEDYRSVQERVSQDSDLTFVVAISGGGSRAANFALGALLALEEIKYEYVDNSPKAEQVESNLFNEIDYFSTVSGGGLAAAVAMMSIVRATRDCRIDPSCPRLAAYASNPDVVKSLRKNYVPRLLYSKLFPDVLFTRKTSGDDFQVQLDRNFLHEGDDIRVCGVTHSQRSYTLNNIFIPNRNEAKDPPDPPCAPYWFMNATDMATGRIVPMTPWNIRRERLMSFWHREKCGGGGNSNQCSASSVPLALALRTSMNYPAGIPATRFQLAPRPRVTSELRLSDGEYMHSTRNLHLTDGGQSDNLGAVTAAAILNQDAELNSFGEDTFRKKRLLILIDAFRGAHADKYDKARTPGLIQSVLRATTLPLDAHRYRVAQDFRHGDPQQPSIMDAISAAGDVAVAYVHIESESQARKVGTTLGLGEETQRTLICTGKWQALVALGMTHLWKEAANTSLPGVDIAGPLSNLSCDDRFAKQKESFGGQSQRERSDQGSQNVVVFNRQRKDRLADALANQFRSHIEVIDEVGESFRESAKQEYWIQVQQSRIDQAIEAVTSLLQSVNFFVKRLKSKEIDPFEKAVRIYVNNAKKLKVELFGEMDSDPRLLCAREDKPSASDLQDPPTEISWREDPISFAMSWFQSAEEAEENGLDGASVSKARKCETEIDPESLNDLRTQFDRVVKAAEDVLDAALSEDVLVGTFTDLSSTVTTLDRRDETLRQTLSAINDNDVDMPSTLKNMEESMDPISWELRELRGLFEQRVHEGLNQFTKDDKAARGEAQQTLEKVDGLVEQDLARYRKSRVAISLDAIDSSAIWTFGDRPFQTETICLFHAHVSSEIVKIKESLEWLAVDGFRDASSWTTGKGLLPQAQDLERVLSNDLQAARKAVRTAEENFDNLLCGWPDLTVRDRFDYNDFKSMEDWSKPRSDYCQPKRSLPYTTVDCESSD